MASSDDEGETFPDAVSEYDFRNKDDEPLSFSKLPVQWNDNESSNVNVMPIFLKGKVDNGLGQLYRQVKAWKYDITATKPQISVLTKDNHWIKLKKPRKSYEVLIRSILISVHCLWFCKSKPEASGKSLRDYLSKVFSLYDPRPSKNDLLDHINFIRESIKRDETLTKSKFLDAFIENPGKTNAFDEDVTKPSFIVDDINGETQDDDITNDDSESDDDDDQFDSVCAICDNGGELTCCEGRCFRSFHATSDSEEAQDSNCESLCLSLKELESQNEFKCENCKYSLHQCFVCGELGSSDKSSNTEVFRCSSAMCGHFYHPKCVAKLLQKNDKTERQTLQEKIAAGEPFICPAHKCAVCKQTENEKVEDLQFATCRRCPNSYHRKCLPRDIKFEHQVGDDDDDEIRAWDGLLSKSRALIYCMEHEIDPELQTPARTIIFRNILTGSKEQPNKKKPVVKVTAGGSGSVDPSKKKSVLNSQKGDERSSAGKPEGSSKKRAAVSFVPEPSKKKKVADGSEKPLRRSSSTKVKKPRPKLNDGQPTLGSRLFDLYTGTESNMENDETSVDDTNQTVAAKPQQTEILPSLDDDSKKRIMALMKEAASSVTLDEVKKYHQGKVPSTHAHSSRVDKSIILARVEGSVEALNLALKKLDEGCSVEDAMAVCERGVIEQLLKWKEKLKVYLAPFLHGMRYTSYGRHFTKVEKLEKIVDKLHWYVEDGDTIVDFCCGANDFSCLMKKRLDETGKKKCSYKNYDFHRPKNDFNFEKRDWMTVSPKELPSGSRLVMGLNPPFGKNAALANKFIDSALKFKPKLIILIVPPETERLDSSKKSATYDLIWEDVELLAGMSFYLPGSVDVNDKIMDQWNNIVPPLYLWSRPDWTNKYKSIAQKHGHIPQVQRLQSEENEPKSDENETKRDRIPVVNKDLKTSNEANKPKNKKRKKESLVGSKAKSEKIIEEKGNQGSSKKTRINQDLKIEQREDQAQKLEEARAPVEAQKRENIRAPVEDQKSEVTHVPVEVKKSEVTRVPVEVQKHETRAPVEAQKHESTRVPSREIDVQKHEETLVPVRELESCKHEKPRAPSREIEEQKPRTASREVEAPKREKARAPSREIEDQKPRATSREIESPKHEKARAPSREIEDQKPRATFREIEAQKNEKVRAPNLEIEDPKAKATSREMEAQKYEKAGAPSREIEAQKHEKARASYREIEDPKPKATYREIEAQKNEKARVPYREFEDPKPKPTYREIEALKHDKARAPSREMETPKQEKTWGPSREFEAQKFENKRPSPRTREEKIHETLNADFSFVDADQRSEERYDSVIDESTFSLENDIAQSYDDYLMRKYAPATDEPYMGGTSHRRLDSANHVPPGYPARADHLQYPPGYERVVNRGPHFDETSAQGGGGGSYSMGRQEPGLTRYSSSDATPYNRTSTSATQRYAPRLDELNHVRASNLGRSELDDMNHMRMGGLGQPEPPVASRGVGGYYQPVNGTGARMDSMGFVPGPYHPNQHNSSGGWLYE
ncbi:putative [histone H3]-lysine(4) N-trimethyltransferase chromatin regulator PHD family [Helianthus debilis subsp. tardiflorus]